MTLHLNVPPALAGADPKPLKPLSPLHAHNHGFYSVPASTEPTAEQLRRQAYAADVQRAHERLLADQPEGLVNVLLILHAPVKDAYDPFPVCRGCDFEGCEGEPPEWPCSTYRMIAEHCGRQFDGGWSQPRMVKATG